MGDIIKDYVTRVRRKVDVPENQKSGKDNKIDDFWYNIELMETGWVPSDKGV